MLIIAVMTFLGALAMMIAVNTRLALKLDVTDPADIGQAVTGAGGHPPAVRQPFTGGRGALPW